MAALVGQALSPAKWLPSSHHPPYPISNKTVATNKAGAITTNPTFKNRQPLISSPSRRNAISHNTVAKDPVTERFGPKSTPISTASRMCAGAENAWIAPPASNPDGKLLTRFDSTAIPNAAANPPKCGVAAHHRKKPPTA